MGDVRKTDAIGEQNSHIEGMAELSGQIFKDVTLDRR
jgi:hypothetical protein